MRGNFLRASIIGARTVYCFCKLHSNLFNPNDQKDLRNKTWLWIYYLSFQLVIGCRTSSHTLTNKRVSPLQDRKEENGGGHYARDIELTSASSDSHRPPRMNNGSLIGAGSESSGQSSSRMSQQTDSSGKFKQGCWKLPTSWGGRQEKIGGGGGEKKKILRKNPYFEAIGKNWWNFSESFAPLKKQYLYLLGPIGPIYVNKFNLCTYLMGVVLAKTENAYFLSRAISHRALVRWVIDNILHP